MSKYVLVEAVSQFRMRYVIEVPDSQQMPEVWAMETVTMQEAKEFSQKWIGETIVSAHEVTHEKIIDLCDEDNDYVSSWPKEQKINTFVTEIGYVNKEN